MSATEGIKTGSCLLTYLHANNYFDNYQTKQLYDYILKCSNFDGSSQTYPHLISFSTEAIKRVEEISGQKIRCYTADILNKVAISQIFSDVSQIIIWSCVHFCSFSVIDSISSNLIYYLISVYIYHMCVCDLHNAIAVSIGRGFVTHWGHFRSQSAFPQNGYFRQKCPHTVVPKSKSHLPNYVWDMRLLL